MQWAAALHAVHSLNGPMDGSKMQNITFSKFPPKNSSLFVPYFKLAET